ncbi:MAG: hypothetical protein ACT443_01635 [Gemmatimonadota bacterium]
MADPKKPAADRGQKPRTPRKDEELEKHEPPHTVKPVPAPKFGSAGSGGAEYERLPEQHEENQENERDKIHES